MIDRMLLLFPCNTLYKHERWLTGLLDVMDPGADYWCFSNDFPPGCWVFPCNTLYNARMMFVCFFHAIHYIMHWRWLTGLRDVMHPGCRLLVFLKLPPHFPNFPFRFVENRRRRGGATHMSSSGHNLNGKLHFLLVAGDPKVWLTFHRRRGSATDMSSPGRN